MSPQDVMLVITATDGQKRQRYPDGEQMTATSEPIHRATRHKSRSSALQIARGADAIRGNGRQLPTGRAKLLIAQGPTPEVHPAKLLRHGSE